MPIARHLQSRVLNYDAENWCYFSLISQIPTCKTHDIIIISVSHGSWLESGWCWKPNQCRSSDLWLILLTKITILATGTKVSYWSQTLKLCKLINLNVYECFIGGSCMRPSRTEFTDSKCLKWSVAAGVRGQPDVLQTRGNEPPHKPR